MAGETELRMRAAGGRLGQERRDCREEGQEREPREGGSHALRERASDGKRDVEARYSECSSVESDRAEGKAERSLIRYRAFLSKNLEVISIIIYERAGGRDTKSMKRGARPTLQADAASGRSIYYIYVAVRNPWMLRRRSSRRDQKGVSQGGLGVSPR